MRLLMLLFFGLLLSAPAVYAPASAEASDCLGNALESIQPDESITVVLVGGAKLSGSYISSDREHSLLRVNVFDPSNARWREEVLLADDVQGLQFRKGPGWIKPALVVAGGTGGALTARWVGWSGSTWDSALFVSAGLLGGAILGWLIEFFASSSVEIDCR